MSPTKTQAALQARSPLACDKELPATLLIALEDHEIPPRLLEKTPREKARCAASDHYRLSHTKTLRKYLFYTSRLYPIDTLCVIFITDL